MSKNNILQNNDQDLPYRPGVGMMIINKEKKIFVAKRIDSKSSNGWQMPQGGIDIGETPSSAALREMHEEIGTHNGRIIAESRKWYSYRVPEFLVAKLWGGKYCGQKQKWFLIEFFGNDDEINLNTDHPEFQSWRWIEIENLHNIVIPFKRKLYREVIKEFVGIFNM